MRSSRERAYNMLNRAQNSKYRLVRDSFIVGTVVGVTIVMHRIIASKLADIFMDIYSKGRFIFNRSESKPGPSILNGSVL